MPAYASGMASSVRETSTVQAQGRAWSEDPRGLSLSAIRVDVDIDAHALHDPSLFLPRRGPITLSQIAQAAQVGDAEILTAVRERLLETEQTLGGPSVLHWRVDSNGNVDTSGARLIDESLPWGGGPSRGMEVTPHLSDRWSRANAGEVMPNVMTPLSWSVISGSLERGFQTPWDDMARDRRFVALFDGYVYFNVGLILELIEERVGLPSAHFLEAVGGPEAEDSSMGTTEFRWSRIVRNLPFMLRALLQQRSLPKRWPSIRAQGETERDRLRTLDLADLSEANILRELSRSAGHAERLVIFLMEAQAVVFSAIQTLLWTIDQSLGPSKRHLALAMLQGLPGVRTQDGNIALRRIAERATATPAARDFVRTHDADSLWPSLQRDDLSSDLLLLRQDLQAFLNEYGHRAAGELEAAQPRWIEQPALILSTFRDYVLQPDAESVDELIARQRKVREGAEQEMRDALGSSLVGTIRWQYLRSLIRQAQTLQPLRENPKFTLLELSLQQRRLWKELASRWIERSIIDDNDDVYYLLFDELTTLTRRSDDAVVAARMRSRIRRRRSQFEAWTSVPAPPLRDRFGTPLSTPSTAKEDSQEAPPSSPPTVLAPSAETLPIVLRGISGSIGAAEGRAHVAESPEAGRELIPGHILIARFTDPGWTPIFPLAAAVVTEIGGVLSHGAIVAREFGIPAVVNVREVTQQVRSGDLIRVDGASGQVTIIERA